MIKLITSMIMIITIKSFKKIILNELVSSLPFLKKLTKVIIIITPINPENRRKTFFNLPKRYVFICFSLDASTAHLNLSLDNN